MVKTQVQIPDHLYSEAKRISREYEMSFAEVVRRGLERIAPVYPPKLNPKMKSIFPKPIAMGFRGLGMDELKAAARETTFVAALSSKGRRAK